MDVTRDLVSFFVMFTADDFSCCLFMALSAFSFVFNKWNAAQSGWVRRLTWPLQNITLFYLQKLLGCFCSMFWFIVQLYYVDWIWADSIFLYTSESIFCHINTKHPVPLEAMFTLSLWSMFHRWCLMLRIKCCSKTSAYFFLPFILVQVDLNFSRPKNAFPEVVWLFFVEKSNLHCKNKSVKFTVNTSSWLPEFYREKYGSNLAKDLPNFLNSQWKNVFH